MKLRSFSMLFDLLNLWSLFVARSGFLRYHETIMAVPIPLLENTTASEVVKETGAHELIALESEMLVALLEEADVIRDDDTCLAGRIRVLLLDGVILVQERTPKGQILVRRLADEGTAHRFVDDRLAVYERMWDGCGCKVDYFRSP